MGLITAICIGLIALIGLIAAICIGLFLFDAKNLCISRTCTKDSFEKILP